ncbi:MAG: VanZ family protein [Pirellulales bacterium]
MWAGGRIAGLDGADAGLRKGRLRVLTVNEMPTGTSGRGVIADASGSLSRVPTGRFSWLRAHSGWVIGLALSYWLLIFVLTHLPSNSLPPRAMMRDKVAHFLAYAGLTFLIGLSFRLKFRMTLTAAFWIVVLAVFYGAVDEITQSLVPGRSTDVRDWMADGLGAMAGLIALEIVVALRSLVRAIPAWMPGA